MARRTLRSRTAGFLIPLAGFLVVTYFVWHGLHGAYGFWAATRLDVRAGELETELAELRAERERLELRVGLLRPESLDPDLLDERARSLLNRAHPDEVVIMYEDE